MKHFTSAALITILAALICTRADQGQVAVPAQSKSPSSGEIVAPGDDLVAEGVPPVPAEFAKEVSRYTGAYGLPLAGWHPAKRELWLKGLSSTVTWLSRIESPGGTARTSVYIPAGRAYDVYIHPRASSLLYTADTAGDERFQIYLYDMTTRRVSALTSGNSRNTEPVWSRAGDKFVYGSAPPDAAGVSLSLMNPLDPQSNRLVAQSGGSYFKAYDWSPDDRWVIYADFASNSVNSLWLLDVASGEKTLLMPRRGEDVGYYAGARFSADAKGVYLITDRDSDVRRLAYFDLATRKFKYLTGGRWDVEIFRLAPDGGTIAYAVNKDGVSRLYLYNIESGAVRPVPAVPHGVIDDIKWHSNSNDVAFSLRSPRAPLDVYVLDSQVGTVERWARSVQGPADPDELVEPELIRWRSFDGLMIPGFIYRPAARFTGKRPVMINIHGGPLEQYRPGYSYTHNYFVNELGVAVIYPNVRGSEGYGKRYGSLDDGVRREDAVKDVGALLDWIKAQPDLDASRIIVRGASYGGYLALSVAAKYGERIRAVVSDSGISNLTSAVEQNERWDRELQRAEFGDERDPKVRDFFERIAPANNAAQIEAPLLVIHGARDARVKIGEAERMVHAARKQGRPVWFLKGVNEGHSFSRRSSHEYQIYVEILFAKKFILK